MLDSIVHSAWQAGTQYYQASPIAESLARLNAADPLRAMLPEVVEALEDSWSPYTDDSPYDVKWAARRENLLTRLRALTATEGGG